MNSEKYQAPFIAIEGLDGSGKSSQVELLGEYLKNKDNGVVLSKEPTTGPIGTLVREILTGDNVVQNTTLESLMELDRKEHVVEIGNNISAGNIYITDRYIFSGLAYNTSGKSLMKLYQENNSTLLPEVVFFIDVSPEEALNRINKRCFLDDTKPEIYENISKLTETKKRFDKIINYYNATNLCNIIRIDGEQSQEKIHEDIKKHIQELDYFKGKTRGNNPDFIPVDEFAYIEEDLIPEANK